MILVLFGQPHSGKSTLAKYLKAYLKDSNIVYSHVDGDELRSLFKNKDYSKEGRIKNLQKASDIAHYLSSVTQVVILSLVYPYKEAREYLNELNSEVIWVYLHYEGKRGREEYHVEDFDKPEDVDLILDTSSENEIVSALRILKLITK
jgi:adenylylsulfate kinase-like enzyme